MSSKERESKKEIKANYVSGYNDKLGYGTILPYCLPMLGMGVMFNSIGMYYMKYATDVLMMAPAIIGLLFGLSRAWDALTDPVCGYLSDITRSKFGRRRIWILLSAPMVAIFSFLLWMPPSALKGTGLVIWVTIALFGFYTAMTTWHIPHYALGGEMSTNYHDKSRIFGTRMMIIYFGAVGAVGFIRLVMGSGGSRSMIFRLTVITGVVFVVLSIFLLMRVREKVGYQGRGGTKIYRSLGNVWKNKHSRLLLSVFFLDMFAASFSAVTFLYYTHYVIGAGKKGPLFLGVMILSGAVFMPVWVMIAKRTSKKATWMAGMVISAISLGLMFFLGKGDLLLLGILCAIGGTGSACGNGIGPAILSDCVDYDEHETGERKEGMYFAFWHFTMKLPYGISLPAVGFMLQFSGFVPGAEQTDTVKLLFRLLACIVPMVGYIIGFFIFSRFSLNKAEHEKIRAEIDKKNGLAGAQA